MESPSELERFLRDHRSEGTAIDEGAFTLSKEMALKKLSVYALPFHNAWVLKIIQAGAVQRAEDDITVQLSSRSVKILFPIDGWTYRQLEEAFYDPEPSGEPGLDHLMVALRVLALQFEWPFAILLPTETERLVWEGESFEMVPHSASSSDRFSIEILPRDGREQSGILNWISASANASRTNSELATALLTWAFMCPKALWVDGVRYDAIQNVGKRTAKLLSYPVCICTPKAELPKLDLPPGTLAGQLTALANLTNPGSERVSDTKAEALSRSAMAGQTVDWSTPAPFLVSLNYRLRTSRRKNEKPRWELTQSSSLVYWVRDGVVVDREPLVRDSSTATIDLFLSAEGLEADISTFNLRETRERAERIDRAVEAILIDLGDLSHLEKNLSAYIETGSQNDLWGAVTLLGLGAVSALVIPFAGLVIGAFGFVGLSNRGSKAKNQVQSLMADIAALVTLLQKRNQQPSSPRHSQHLYRDPGSPKF